MSWPKVGDTVAFGQESGEEIDLTILQVRADCAMLEVMDEDGECGSLVIHKSGAWWWLKKIDVAEPWMQSLGKRNAWKGDIQ